MSRSSAALLTGALAVASAVPGLAAASAPSANIRLPGFPPAQPLVAVSPGSPLAWPATRAVAVRPSRPVQLEVALKPSHEAALHRLLSSLYDPSSPTFHHFLAHGAFARRFAPSRSAVARLRAFLAGHGLSVRLSGFALSVSGPAAKVEAAFHVRLVQHGAGLAAAEVPAGPLLLPRRLVPEVAGVVGASSAPAAVPHLVRFRLTPRASRLAHQGARLAGPASSATPSRGRFGSRLVGPELVPSACPSASAVASADGAVTLDQLGAHYGITPLLAAGADGAGETVAVYELAAHDPSAVAAYLACEGLATPVSTVPVDGGGTLQQGGGTTEANLDIEQLATQAPGASVLAYEGPDTSAGEYDVWAAIVGADQASVVSTSWGLCEAASSGTIPGEDTLFAEAAAQGQTIVAASGDSGSEDCLASGQDAPSVDYPASDPYVTGVGGTTLSGASDVVWNDCPGATSSACAQAGGHAGGGGPSSYFTEPSWQQPLDTLATSSAGCGGAACRGVPDLAANAGTGEIIYDAGGWAAVGGTSAAAPLVAGLAADLEETCAAPLGALDPGLYGSAAAGAYGTGLSDVTSGGNDLSGAALGRYQAAPGYDLASGLGAPIGAGLACPGVTSLSPAAAPAGAQVTVAGTNLAHATIDFGATRAQVLSATAISATVVVPAGSGTAAVRASSPIGAGRASAAFQYASTRTSSTSSTGSGPSAAGNGASSSGPAGSSVSDAGSGAGAGTTAGGSSTTPTPASGPDGATGTVPPTASGPVASGLVQVQARVQGTVVAMRWRRPARNAVEGYVLAVGRCALHVRCRMRRYLLGATRSTVALHVGPGRYRLALSALERNGETATVTRSVTVVPRRVPPTRRSRTAAARRRTAAQWGRSGAALHEAPPGSRP